MRGTISLDEFKRMSGWTPPSDFNERVREKIKEFPSSSLAQRIGCTPERASEIVRDALAAHDRRVGTKP